MSLEPFRLPKQFLHLNLSSNSCMIQSRNPKHFLSTHPIPTCNAIFNGYRQRMSQVQGSCDIRGRKDNRKLFRIWIYIFRFEISSRNPPGIPTGLHIPGVIFPWKQCKLWFTWAAQPDYYFGVEKKKYKIRFRSHTARKTKLPQTGPEDGTMTLQDVFHYNLILTTNECWESISGKGGQRECLHWKTAGNVKQEKPQQKLSAVQGARQCIKSGVISRKQYQSTVQRCGTRCILPFDGIFSEVFWTFSETDLSGETVVWHCFNMGKMPLDVRWQTWLLLTILSLAGFSSVSCISFHLPVNVRKCLREEVQKDNVVKGEFELSVSTPEIKTNIEVGGLGRPIFPLFFRFEFCRRNNNPPFHIVCNVL